MHEKHAQQKVKPETNTLDYLVTRRISTRHKKALENLEKPKKPPKILQRLNLPSEPVQK